MRWVLPLLGPELEQKGEHHEPHRPQTGLTATTAGMDLRDSAAAGVSLRQRRRDEQPNTCTGHERHLRSTGSDAGANDDNRRRC